MKLTWGYMWGIWWWRITGEQLDADRLRTDLANIPGVIASSRELGTVDVQATRNRGLASGIPQSVPMDVVTTGKDPNIRNRSLTVHLWNGFVPVGSICMARVGYYVSSPEFCSLQVASILKRLITVTLRPWQYIVILAELVCELCGTYSKQNTVRGFKDRVRPLTSVAKLAVFCNRMAFELGVNTLRRALCWVIDGLNSPKETALFLMLCLPRRCGGLEFPKPVSNVSIPIPMEL